MNVRPALILREARTRYRDSEALSNVSRTDSAYLLSLLALELFLKYVYEAELGEHAPSNHHYDKIFQRLPGKTQTNILGSARNRIGPSALNVSPMEILSELGQNFINLRYPYSKYSGFSEEEYLQRGREWHDKGAPLNQADFRYWPEELFALLYAFDEYTSSA